MKALSIVSSAASSTFIRRPQHLNRCFATNLSKQCKSLQAPLLAGNINPSFSNFRLIAMAAPQNEDNIDVPKSVPVRVAHELLQAGHRYLDVRTPEEFSGGHAVGAVNVPYMFKAGNGMTKNPNFLDGVAKHFGKDAEIVVGCLSGKRSLMAATDLSLAGYSGVTDMAGGYSAWSQNGLPTE
ncbi:Thiosulfate sulfurtransferase 16 [Ranunculus cassubicifolius]